MSPGPSQQADRRRNTFSVGGDEVFGSHVGLGSLQQGPRLPSILDTFWTRSQAAFAIALTTRAMFSSVGFPLGASIR